MLNSVIGLVPAAGRGARISPLPCSKELFPLGLVPGATGAEPRVRVVAEYLLEQFRTAGIARVMIILRQGKWDIPAYFGDGTAFGLDIAYMVIDGSSGPPATVARAFGFVGEQLVAFGFPDIICTPPDIYARLLARQRATGADAVLGLFPAHDPRVMDMVRTDASGRVTDLDLKPATTDLTFAWACAVWAPAFSRFLHDFVNSDAAGEARRQGGRRIDAQGDLPAGAVVQAAVRQGLHIDSVAFPDGTYLDIGTPADLARAMHNHRTSAAAAP